MEQPREQQLRQFLAQHSGQLPRKMGQTFLQLANRSSSRSFRVSHSHSLKVSPLASKRSSPVHSASNSPQATKRRGSQMVLKPVVSQAVSSGAAGRQQLPKRVPEYRSVQLSAGYFLFEKYPVLQFDVSLVRSSSA